MPKGIQIKKPDRMADTKLSVEPLEEQSSPKMPAIFYIMLILTFPAAGVALYFLVRARLV